MQGRLAEPKMVAASAFRLSDFGTVTLMAERVLTKRYGSLLLVGLPFPRHAEEASARE